MPTTRHTAYKFRVGDKAYTSNGVEGIIVGRFRYPKLFKYNIYNILFDHDKPARFFLDIKVYSEETLYVNP